MAVVTLLDLSSEILGLTGFVASAAIVAAVAAATAKARAELH